MNKLILEATEDTPNIRLDRDKGLLEFSGRSLPEDIFDFYNPVYKWLDTYLEDPPEKTICNIKIDYFNSASQRALNEIFVNLSQIKLKKKEIVIEWHFIEDDDEILDMGKEFEELCGLSFSYISYNP